MKEMEIEAEEREIVEDVETVVIYNESAKQYLVKIPIKIARLMAFKGGEKLKFRVTRKGSEKKLEIV